VTPSGCRYRSIVNAPDQRTMSQVDAVVLATPTDTHRDLCLAALRASVDVPGLAGRTIMINGFSAAGMGGSRCYDWSGTCTT